MSARSKTNRLLLHVTCQCHDGPPGFTNLVVTRNDSTVMLNPHVDNSCVLILDDAAAGMLHHILGEWLSIPVPGGPGGVAVESRRPRGPAPRAGLA